MGLFSFQFELVIRIAGNVKSWMKEVQEGGLRLEA